ncbi:MAG: hypothetical protein E6H10_10535 [Bacteroidetes bacterium]|nr:MAG: hypothetical protein E6H10_10535 [Bacteroidota bacterium]
MKNRRVIKVGLVFIVGICLIIIAALFSVDAIIEKKIRSQLSELSPALQIKFSRVRSRIFSSSVSFDSLQISFTPYGDHKEEQHAFLFTKVSLQGIHFLNLLFHKKLVAKDLLLAGGSIHLSRSLLEARDSAQMEMIREMKSPFRNLAIDRIQLRQSNIFLHSARDDELLARGDVSLRGVAVDKPGTRPVFSGLDVNLSDINYASSDFIIGIRRFELSSSGKTLTINSLHVSKNGKQNLTRISSLKITGLEVSKFLEEQTLICKRIKVEDGSVVLANNKIKAPFDLKQVHADVFELHNLLLTYQGNGTTLRTNANIELGKLDVGEPFDKKNFHFASVRATLSDIQYSGNNYQTARIKKIDVDSKKQFILADEISIIPKIGKYELGRKLGHQADWIAANVSRIEISRPNIEGLLHHKLLAEKVLIGQSRIYIFRDRRPVRQQKFIPLPVEYLKKVPFDLRVQNFMLASSTVEYEEFPESGFGQTGVLMIKNAKVMVSPLINHPLASDPNYSTMNTTGSIMGSGTVHGTILMPLVKNKPYYVKGAIEKLQLTKLNSSSENLGKIRIKSGFLDFLSFDFIMTEQRSTGKIIGAYHRLIIQQLKKHTDEKNVADFASFMLRHLIIPLDKDVSVPERKRTGKVDYIRDPTRFVSYYLLQSLLMGVKKSFTLGFLLPK